MLNYHKFVKIVLIHRICIPPPRKGFLRTLAPVENYISYIFLRCPPPPLPPGISNPSVEEIWIFSVSGIEQ